MTGDAHPFLQRSPFRIALFRMYLSMLARLRFSAVRISCVGTPQEHVGSPLVIYSNHPSWWDPAIVLIIGEKLFPGRLIFGPMAATELAKWQFFKRLGVFGLEPGRGGAANFLAVAKAGLANPRAVLWVTPEGAFTDARTRPLRLQPGIAHLARDLPGVVFLPLALEYPFWNASRPEVLLQFGLPLTSDGTGTVSDWSTRLTASLTTTMDCLATKGMTRNPGNFVSLLPGKTV